MHSSGTLILPIVLWDDQAPKCQITSLLVSESEKYMFTGTTSGHIIMWEFNVDEIVPLCLMIGHTSVVNCLAKAGSTREEEYIVSSSENGEMKLWEINEKKCIENIKMPNTVHKNIYSSKVNGKYTRLFCIGNYTDVLVMDPIALDILYTLISRENPQWIKALCINSLANKQDDVIVGVSISGTIKLWTVNSNEVKGAEIVEHEFRNCLCENASTLASCPGKQRIFIVVCPKFFQIFDAFDFTVLSQVNISDITPPANGSKTDETVIFLNGFFIDIEYVIVTASDGYAYLFALPELVNPQSPSFRQKSDKFHNAKLFYRFEANDGLNGLDRTNSSTSQYCPPIFCLYEQKKQASTNAATTPQTPQAPAQPLQKYLLRGDSNGKIALWNVNLISNNKIKPSDYEISLKKFWKENVKHDNDHLGYISTLLYLPTIDKIVYGLMDGSIIISPAIEFLIRKLFRRPTEIDRTNTIKLKQHTDKVTCILYPHAEHPRYDPTMLVTGSRDFSIILWNINTGEMVHRFVVQTGEILQLSVPPNTVNPRILQCICSIASDHSVALLSLKECKPVMVANRHIFPVLFVKWRPLDDYLLVKCSDGGVFVWQIETGNLDRMAHGLLAEDILNAADEIIESPEMFTAANASSTSSAAATAPTSASLIIPPQSSFATQPISVASYSTPMIISSKTISNQTIALAHVLQKRNFAHAVKAISQKLATVKDDPKKLQTTIESASLSFPLIIQPFHLSPNDSVKHLLLFDIDSLLTTLILEEFSMDTIVKHIKNNIFKDIHNIQTAPTQVISPLYRTTPDYSLTVLKRNASAKLFDSIDMKEINILKSKIKYAQSIINLTHILLSSLHVWSIDANLDKLFADKLSLRKPKYPIAFGRISRGSHFFVMFPPKRAAFSFSAAPTTTPTNPMPPPRPIPKDKSFNLMTFEDEAAALVGGGELVRKNSLDTLSGSNSSQSIGRVASDLDTPSPSVDFWLATKIITTEHLVTILAISNAFMNLQSFIDLQIKRQDIDPMEFILGESIYMPQQHLSSSPPTSSSLSSGDTSQEQSLIRQTYSRLSTMYCMLTDYYKNELSTMHTSFKSLNLESLALKWMDPSYEIREAAQTLLKNELKRIGPNGRAALIKSWEPHLTSLLKDFDELNQINIQQQQQQQQQLQQSQQPQQQTSQQPQPSQAAQQQPGQPQSGSMSAPTSQQQQQQLQQQSGAPSSQYEVHHVHYDSSTSLNLAPHSNRIKRKQYVSIIILSLIGAEFGQDVNANKSQMPYKTIPQGFSLEDHSILKRISTALSSLVTNKSLHYDITRRVAIDLMGRGFNIWEPFIQPTYVLLSLLELSSEAELYTPRLTINLPLTPIADLCKVARNSLTLIANSKPKTFILTIAKEIKRINATSTSNSAQHYANYTFSGALTRGKPEILLIIERLIDNQAQDVFELISDVIEIILFCLDPNQIRTLGLEECFRPLFKFPMVRYCKETKRIVCGCHNGRLVMYEFKTSKWNFQSYPAHNNQPIAAVAVSGDSKYIASYSAHDNSLIFWQSSGGNIFNIGSSSLKQIKHCNAAPVDLNMSCTRLAYLQWQNKTLYLTYHDNRKFSYSI